MTFFTVTSNKNPEGLQKFSLLMGRSWPNFSPKLEPIHRTSKNCKIEQVYCNIISIYNISSVT